MVCIQCPGNIPHARATKPMHHNYWARGLRPAAAATPVCHNNWSLLLCLRTDSTANIEPHAHTYWSPCARACALQRRHCSEKPTEKPVAQHSKEYPCFHNQKSLCKAAKTQHSLKEKEARSFKNKHSFLQANSWDSKHTSNGTYLIVHIINY